MKKLIIALALLASAAPLIGMRGELKEHEISHKTYLTEIPKGPFTWEQARFIGASTTPKGQAANGDLIYIRQHPNGEFEADYYKGGSGGAKFLSHDLTIKLLREAGIEK